MKKMASVAQTPALQGFASGRAIVLSTLRRRLASPPASSRPSGAAAPGPIEQRMVKGGIDVTSTSARTGPCRRMCGQWVPGLPRFARSRETKLVEQAGKRRKRQELRRCSFSHRGKEQRR